MAALDDVARSLAPITLRLTGVTMSIGGVMVQAEPYSSIVHCAGPILDAPGLVDWVGQNSQSLHRDVSFHALSLVRFRYLATDRQRLMAMEHWHSAALTTALRAH
ncbi:hypothetical protein [Nocardioides exalbidus]|nr:hypothetical protein [Nocardioides exalbidus]